MPPNKNLKMSSLYLNLGDDCTVMIQDTVRYYLNWWFDARYCSSKRDSKWLFSNICT